MNDLKLVIRTADRARKAEIDVPSELTGADVVQAAVDKWSLPKDTDYSLVNATQQKTLNTTESLLKAGVLAGDVLEVQPVLLAGASDVN